MGHRVETFVDDKLPANVGDGVLRRRPARAVADGVAWFIHHATWRMRLLEYAWPMVDRELASTVRVPWHVRPVMWRRGFLSESWVLYDFANNDWRDYLPDRARYAKARMINGDHSILLDDKLALQRFLGPSAGDLLPTVYGTISKGQITTSDGRLLPYCTSGRWLRALAREHGRIIVKPSRGGGGRGVHVLQAMSDGTLLDGRPVSDETLLSLVAASDGHMICEHVSQHADIARLFPCTTNTVRVLVMQDDRCRPFIAAAVLRVGTSRSVPTDNWIRGGLCADVCVTSGLVKNAAPFPAHCDALSWHSRHPETGVPIAGLKIPNWEGIKRGLTDLMRAQPAFRYVGWDVVATQDGYRILEGNNFSNVNLIQIHRPLLCDERVVHFYRRNGVLPSARRHLARGIRT